ncbi:pif5 [Cryptophlebia peltastica nucleopolyhedrovirus]|uniref:Pif5 n=1 Tax=Cryptophlebia peltastica nucleopolyhedrovirus TaxID=2304025 RepID=A0A346RNM5_9ABAC|nr:pif5 [Cryptophlebia peltastica nucleopolyhedrovirus]AXS67672.1 pif5 [Cryptophlebia peltastica nucleopolyhedrovirus]
MSFFTSLRRVNKVYNNPNQFLNVDNLNVVNSSPAGFQNVFSSSSFRNLNNDMYMPGYLVRNNDFVSVADMNRFMRNNDSTNLRTMFPDATNGQLNSLGSLRRIDNVPDANLHSINLRKNAVKQNYPSTNTRNANGVETVLTQQPRLRTYLENLKLAGVTALIGTGVYLAFSTASLIQDIINALNNTGGSYFYVGFNGGDDMTVCMLRHRTCQLNADAMDRVVLCEFDPLISNEQELLELCRGFNYETEQTVCRASDPNADPESPQYVDISDLSVGQTIQCIEPYNLGDLIGDLGLDHLLGEEGLVNKSMNKSKSLGEKLLPLIMLVGGLLIMLAIGIFIFKQLLTKPLEPMAR